RPDVRGGRPRRTALPERVSDQIGRDEPVRVQEQGRQQLARFGCLQRLALDVDESQWSEDRVPQTVHSSDLSTLESAYRVIRSHHAEARCTPDVSRCGTVDSGTGGRAGPRVATGPPSHRVWHWERESGVGGPGLRGTGAYWPPVNGG